MILIILIFLAIFVIIGLETMRKQENNTVKTVCPSCDNNIDNTFKYCPYCSIQLKKDCENCGNIIKPFWKICPHCGLTIVKERNDE